MRLKVLKRLILVFFLLLAMSLAYSQLIKGHYYLQLSRNNRIKLIELSATRGLIYDRNKTILAGLRLIFNVALLPQEIQDIRQTLDKLGPILGIAPDKLLRQFRKNRLAPFIPVVLVRDVPKKTAIALESQESDIPGLIIQTEALRDYRYGETLCHVLGYLGRINEKELSRFKSYGLQVKGLVGKSGLEQEFDHCLRGQSGGMQVEVNNRGELVKILGSKQAQAGENLHLTIDVRLQEFVARLLKEKKGACIVANPQNGEILAMVSKPSFDPNLFIAVLTGKLASTVGAATSTVPTVDAAVGAVDAAGRVKELLTSKEAALLNRAISGSYSPGSIFKIVVAAAGLESGKITPETTVHCSGSLKVGNRDFFCWNLDGHGRQDLYSALAHSCNVFFYKSGLSLGPDILSLFARKFGLGLPTGIDLPYESKGLVPSKNWKLKNYKERWYDGETANFSIGQGFLLTTPLQITQMVSAIANGGNLVRPHIVKKTGSPHSKLQAVIATKNLQRGGQDISILRKNIALKKETLEIIKEGMRRVIQDEQGTGHNASIPGVQWAGKTGTTQTAKGIAHGWFAGFYPFEEPRILVLVFLEYGGSGGEAPARMAKKIVEYIIENGI